MFEFLYSKKLTKTDLIDKVKQRFAGEKVASMKFNVEKDGLRVTITTGYVFDVIVSDLSGIESLHKIYKEATRAR